METQLCSGSSEVVITPPLGVSMAGYYHDRRADDVLDDLYAKALVLRSGSTTAALVVCDLIGLDRATTTEIRAMVEGRLGIPPSHVMICCTHTHTGPQTVAWAAAGQIPDGPYMAVLKRKVADAVQLAYQRCGAVLAQVGRGQVQGVGFNRRYWMRDGTVRTNPPYGSPDIVRRAGPMDTELGILLFRGAAGDPQALVSNYTVHPDQIGGTAISADHEGAEAVILKQVLGQHCAVLCPQGCCGDINHVDFFGVHRRMKGYDAAWLSGSALAGEVIRQLANLGPVDDATVRAGSRVIQAELRVPSDEELAWARGAADAELHGFDAAGLDVVRAHRMIRIHEGGVAHIPVEISAITIGDVALVGLPGEAFVQLGLAIKERSPFGHTYVMELCNASIGYVPTEVAYGEGGYEATNTRLQPGTGEQFVETALEVLAELHA